MKLIFVSVLLLLFSISISHKLTDKKNLSNSRTKTAIKKLAQKPKTIKKAPRVIKTIPFREEPSKEVNEKINSLGAKVNKHLALEAFPFKVKRCDQIILFPAKYINDHDDFRVRREGFVAITAHYTNLFAGEDGQKLIQQVISANMRGDPTHIVGARGCIKVPGGIGQKSPHICVGSFKKAQNLLNVYEEFSRCRLGDNLQPIPAHILKELLRLCGIDRNKLMGSGSAAALSKFAGLVELKKRATEKNPKGDLTEAAFQAKKELIRRLMKNKKKPSFTLPRHLKNNPWEADRRSFVQYKKLQVPGTR